MLFIVIGIFVVVALGAFLRQQSKTSTVTEEENIQPEQQIAALDLPDEEEEQPEFTLTAKPVTSPELVSGATYSAHAPAGEESPYGRSSEQNSAVVRTVRKYSARQHNHSRPCRILVQRRTCNP